MRRLLQSVFAIGLVAVLAACAPQAQLPTLVPTDVPTNTPAPSPTPEPTRTPRPSPTPAPTKPPTLASNPAEQAYVRTIHAAPQSEAVDFYIETLNISSYVQYGQFIDQIPIVAGTYLVRAFAAGTRDLSQPLAEARLVIQGQQVVNLILVGTSDALRLSLSTENRTPLPAATSRVTLINALTGEQTISLQSNSEVLIDGLGQTTASPSFNVPAGAADYNVVIQESALPINLPLRERRSYTLLAIGDASDSSTFQLLNISAELPGTVPLRVLNMLVNGEALDVYLDGKLLQTAVQRDASILNDVASGERVMTLYPNGADPNSSAPLLNQLLPMNPYRSAVLIISGQASQPAATLYVADERPLQARQARVSFFNAAFPDESIQVEGNVDIGLRLAYGQLSAVDVYTTGDFPLSFNRINADGTQGESVTTGQFITLEEGNNYLYIITPLSNDVPPLVLTTAVAVIVGTPTPSALVATSVPAPTLRIVNAIEGQTVEVRIDDRSIGEVAARGTSNITTVESGQRVLTALNIQTQELLLRSILDFSAGEDYSIYLFENGTGIYAALPSLDSELYGQLFDIPALRLVNISPEITTFAAYYSLPTLTIVSDPNAVDPNNPVVERSSLPLGLDRAAASVSSGNIGKLEYIALGAGSYDFFISDANTNTLAGLINNVTLSGGVIYDLIVFQRPGTLQVVSYLVPYQAP